MIRINWVWLLRSSQDIPSDTHYKNLEDDFLKNHRDHFRCFSSSGGYDYVTMDVGAAALCKHHLGCQWPTLVRFFGFSDSHQLYQFGCNDPTYMPSTPRPEMAIVFLFTDGHQMMLLHDRSYALGLDGKANSNLQCLADGAMKCLTNMGFESVVIDFKPRWTQPVGDDSNCGRFCLDFLGHFLRFRNSIFAEIPDYIPPPNWDAWNLFMTSLLPHINVQVCLGVHRDCLHLLDWVYHCSN